MTNDAPMLPRHPYEENDAKNLSVVENAVQGIIKSGDFKDADNAELVVDSGSIDDYNDNSATTSLLLRSSSPLSISDAESGLAKNHINNNDSYDKRIIMDEKQQPPSLMEEVPGSRDTSATAEESQKTIARVSFDCRATKSPFSTTEHEEGNFSLPRNHKSSRISKTSEITETTQQDEEADRLEDETRLIERMMEGRGELSSSVSISDAGSGLTKNETNDVDSYDERTAMDDEHAPSPMEKVPTAGIEAGVPRSAYKNIAGSSSIGLSSKSMPMRRRCSTSQSLMRRNTSVRMSTRKSYAFSYMEGDLKRMSGISSIQHRVISRIHDALHPSPIKQFYLFFFILPTAIALWYAAAILFPAHWHEDHPFLVWTPSARTRNVNTGALTICPRQSICSEGSFQVFLISVARLTAFASYVVQGLVFASKMHSTIHFLSNTYVATIIPFASLHHVHAFTGSIYAALIFLHTAAHFIRWGMRYEMAHWWCTNVGLSGIIGAVAMAGVVFVMSPWGKKVAIGSKGEDNKRKLSFEQRFSSHQVFFWILTIAICFHTKRTRNITLSYFLLWLLDSIYGWIFRTHRLDVVEFIELPESSGTQMLWKNPDNFYTKSGEFVRVRIPWLNHGGKEWHPFSIYLKEATKEGLEEVHRKEMKETGRIFLGEESKGGRQIDLSKTAVLLIEFQNEFVHPRGGLYENVKGVLDSTNAIANVTKLVEEARKIGVKIIHAPVTVKKDGSNNPNAGLGILKNVYKGSYFTEGSWNAELCDELKPRLGDLIVKGKHGLDCFLGSNLEELLISHDIETLIIGGLLTNCCVESTMRTAYEKGLNTITLVDGTACNSRAEQIAACNTTFKMFSTPMKCDEVVDIFKGKLFSGMGMRSTRFLRGSVITMESTPDLTESGVDDGEILEAEKTLEEFADDVLSNPFTEGTDVATIARQGLMKNDTTQIFIMPAGDWTKGLVKQVEGRDHMRSCWVRGPYTSPYFVASDFSHSVLMASGIGITPALGVMGQFPGASKTKILVWSVRSKNMLKFFAPLLKDAHLAAIFYTGKDKLSVTELKRIRSHGNIFVQQSRPASLTETIASLIVLFERSFAALALADEDESDEMEMSAKDYLALQTIRTMNDLPLDVRHTWVLLYCGGSIRIRDDLAAFAKKTKIGWQAELFDW